MLVAESLTPEQLDALGEEIATFATRIDVAEHALLTRLRVFDTHEAWANQGARSCAEWLSWRGCGRNRHVHAHHIEPWAEGGSTRLSNLVLVCSGHHRMIHEGRLESRICEGKIEFVDARGRAMPAVAASVATGYELEELERFLGDADLYIDGSTAPTWDGTRVGIAEALDWMLLAERGLRAA
jgi:hypothetical protein